MSSHSKRRADESISGEQSVKSIWAKGRKTPPSNTNLRREESLDPVISIKGRKTKAEQTGRAGWSFRMAATNDEESLDPVLSIKGDQSARSEWASDSLLGKSIRIQEKKNSKRKPLNPMYGNRSSQRSLVSTIYERSLASTSTYFREEVDRPDVGYLHKYKQFLCIGILLFFLVDAILLAVFFRPLNKATGSKLSNQNQSLLGDESLDNEESPVISTSAPTYVDNDNAATNDNGSQGSIRETKMGRFELVETAPHDAEASTQGLDILSFDKIKLMKQQHRGASEFNPPSGLQTSYTLESTGQYGDSTLRIVDLASGEGKLAFFMNEMYFGKGCTYFYDPPDGENKEGKIRIIQLTWDEGKGFVYDLILPTEDKPQWAFLPMGDFQYASHTTNGKGRGIVYHPLRQQFIVSDDSSYLHFWELTDESSFTFYTDTDYITTFQFRLVEKVQVRSSQGLSDWVGFRNLNDLTWDPFSYGGNTILANVGTEKKVVRIWVGSPDDDDAVGDEENNLILSASFTRGEDVGKISHVYDLSELDEANDMNAIAFAYESSIDGVADESSEDEFWVTGSNWSSMYRVRLVDE